MSNLVDFLLSNWVSIIGFLGGLMTLYFAAQSVRASIYIRRSEFEDIYVQRYWDIQNQMPIKLRVVLIDEGDLTGLSESEQKALWDYLALCEDEIDLRRIGRITDESWAVWCSDIENAIKGYPYRNMLEYVMRKLGKDTEYLRAHDPLPDVSESHADDGLPFANLRKIYFLQCQDGYQGIDPTEWPVKQKRWSNWIKGRREALRDTV